MPNTEDEERGSLSDRGLRSDEHSTVAAKHTPGPWRYQEKSDAYTHIVRAGDRFICQLAQDTSGRAEADARLIAAAPDLLAALKRARSELYDHLHSHMSEAQFGDEVAYIDDAIANATQTSQHNTK